jgi:hypothetical protein
MSAVWKAARTPRAEKTTRDCEMDLRQGRDGLNEEERLSSNEWMAHEDKT